MGFLKFLYYIVIFTSVLFLALNHAPNLLDIEPQVYNPNLWKLEGSFTPNKDLEKAEIVTRDMSPPESFAFVGGDTYAALNDGKVVLIRDDKVIKTVADTCKGVTGLCRLLALRFYKNNLYLTNVGRGLLKVNPDTGAVQVLLSTSKPIGGKDLTFPYDLDIDDQGQIYMTDFSTRWTVKKWGYNFMEHENTGRVIKYDIQTGEAEVILENLFSPSGIQISHDRKSLLIAETSGGRILRHHLQGPKKGQAEVFADLPGSPDKLRANPRGGYWITNVICRDSSSPLLIDRLASYPKIRKALARLVHIISLGLNKVAEYLPSPVLQSISGEFESGSIFILLAQKTHSAVLELNSDGNIIRSMHSQIPELSLFAQASEKDGHLYLGTFYHPFVARLKV